VVLQGGTIILEVQRVWHHMLVDEWSRGGVRHGAAWVHDYGVRLRLAGVHYYGVVLRLLHRKSLIGLLVGVVCEAWQGRVGVVVDALCVDLLGGGSGGGVKRGPFRLHSTARDRGGAGRGGGVSLRNAHPRCITMLAPTTAPECDQDNGTFAKGAAFMYQACCITGFGLFLKAPLKTRVTGYLPTLVVTSD